MNRKEILEEISELIVKKGVPDKPVNEGITRGDGRVVYQLTNYHKRLMSVYESLPDGILKREYDILKFDVEGKKDVDQQSDQTSDSQE